LHHIFSRSFKKSKDNLIAKLHIYISLNGCVGFSFDRVIFIGLQQSKKKPFRTGLKAVLKTVM
jgi:hypothetical protein